MRSTTAILAVLLLTASSAFATTYYIKDDGTGDFPTIKAGLIIAGGGDILLVADGEYTETNLDFSGKAIVLISENGPVNCTIKAGLGGGRIFLFGNSEGPGTVIDGFTIRNANSTYGGAAFIQGASPTFVNNIFRDNLVSNNGGAVYITSSSSSPTFINNIFDNNEADEGGAIYNENGGPIIRNNTIAFNVANFGAGIRFDGPNGVTVTDNILWGNWGAGQVDGAVSGSFTNNLIEGWSGPAGNFDGHPRFVSGPEGSFYLGGTSDAIDAGSMLAADMCFTTGSGTLCMDLMTTDPSNSADTGTLDVGFHRGPLPRTIEVPGDYATIQAALDAAYDGDTVQLARMKFSGPGNRDLDFHGKAVTLRGDPADPSGYVLDIEGSSSDVWRGIWFHSGEGPDSVVEGIRIDSGYATDTGGGIKCEGSSPTLLNVEIRNCYAGVDGGGIACHDHSSPVLDGCLINSNEAGDDGGGLYAHDFSSPDIDDTVFRHNNCNGRGGGALFAVNSFPTVDNCRFNDNTANEGGGMAFVYAYGPVTDCLIYQNFVSGTGGGVQCYGNAQCTFTRCTIVMNDAPISSGAGVWCRNNSSPTFENTIIALNIDGQAVGRYADDCNPTFACCDIFGNDGGDWVGFIQDFYKIDGNFAGDPYFCNPGLFDFTLVNFSLCLAALNPGCGQIGALGVGCAMSPVPQDLPVEPAAKLVGCYPNPFNPATTVKYELSTPGPVSVRIYDLAGRLVRVLKNGEVEQPGLHDTPWNGRDDNGHGVAAGIYVVRLEAGALSDVMQVALVK